MLSLWLADFITRQGGTFWQKEGFFLVLIGVEVMVFYAYGWYAAWKARRKNQQNNDEER